VTTYVINDQTDFDTACAAHVAGDIFQFSDGVDVTVPNPWDGTFELKKNCRWEVPDGRGAADANPLGAPGGSDGTFSACFTRRVIVRGFFKLQPTATTSDTIYIGPISFRLPTDVATMWPGAGQTWTNTVGISDLSFARAQPIFNGFYGTITLDDCEWDHGWGPTAAAHSMETAYTTENADHCYYGPSATFGNVGTIVAGDIRLKSINGRGFVGKLTTGASLTVNAMWSEKTVTDFNQWSVDAQSATAAITFGKVIIFDAIGGNVNGRLGYSAIHADSFQLGAINANGICPRIRINNFIVINSLDPDLAIAGPIGTIQGVFLVAPATTTINGFYNNIVVRNGLMLGVNKGVQIDCGTGAYVRNVVSINPTILGSEAQTYNASFELKQSRSASNARYGHSYVGSSIFEGISSTSGLTQENNTVLSKQDAAQSSVFAGGSTPATLWEWFSYYKATGSYATKGPQHATLRDFLDDTLDFTGEPVFFKPNSLSNQARSTSVTTPCAAIYGGDDGDLLDVVLPSGLTMQVLENDETTVLQTITSAGNGTATNRVPVGKQGRFTVTTGAGYDDLDSYDYTIGGETFTWTVRTESNVDLPGVTYDANRRFSRAAGGAVAAANGKHAMMWMDFVLNSAPTSFQALFAGTSNRTLRTQVTPNGGGYNIYFYVADSAGANAGGLQVNALVYGTRYRIGFSVDNTASTGTLWRGCTRVSDGVAISPSVTAGGAGGNDIAWTHAHGAGFPAFGGPNITLYGLFLDNDSLQNRGIAEPTDWNFVPINIGPNGEGLKANPAHNWMGVYDAATEYQTNDGVESAQGNYFVSLIDNNIGNTPPATATSNANWQFVERRPLLFIPGETAPTNRGTGSGWALNGTGSMTAVNSEVWPLNLTLEAIIQTVGPYVTGSPIDILVRPVVGYPEDVNITAASDAAGAWAATSKELPKGRSAGIVFTFTPSAAGTHTFTFTDDAGYTDPTSPTASVTSSGGGAVTVRVSGLSLGMRMGL
jgi:hypothetical protein